MEVVASLSQGRTVAAQCGLFTHKSVPVIVEPPCILGIILITNTLLAKWFSGDQIDGDCRSCATYGGEEKCTEF